MPLTATMKGQMTKAMTTPASTVLSRLHSLPPTPRMPVLFLGHGNPMNAIEENQYVDGFRTVAATLPKPAAVLCVSAHWETWGTAVTAMPQPRTIHDFGGFPAELYRVQYPAPGHPELASATQEILQPHHVAADQQWGLDHGAWSVLRHFFPQADVPVIQLSLNRNLRPAEHYELAQRLRALRDHGVLIVGSGNIVHNLAQVAWNRLDEPGFGYDWALEAQLLVAQKIREGDHTSLMNYAQMGRALQLAVPTPEHFLPLLYTLALQDPADSVQSFNDSALGGSLTMTSLRIG